jgi:hypothetical protein
MARIKASTRASLKPLAQERDRLETQMMRLWEQAEALRNKIAGLDVAIALIEGGGDKELEQPANAVSASNIKDLLLTLAKDAGTTGLNANVAVGMAGKKGITLKRGTAASNLSRLKALGLLIHDGKSYRLPEFTRPQLQLAVGGKGS